MKLSFIIYLNSDKKSLINTLDSVLKEETNYKYEIILINDAKEEDLKDVIKPYKYFIHLIEFKEARGIIKSYEEALKIAKGSYISFLTTRDIIKPHFLERLSESNADIISFSYQLKYSNSEEKAILSNKKYQKNLDCFIINNPFFFNKIYRKEVLCNISSFNSLLELGFYLMNNVKTAEEVSDILLTKNIYKLKLDRNINLINNLKRSETYFKDKEVYEFLNIKYFLLDIYLNKNNNISKDEFIRRFPKFYHNKYVKDLNFKNKLRLFLIKHNLESLIRKEG